MWSMSTMIERICVCGGGVGGGGGGEGETDRQRQRGSIIILRSKTMWVSGWDLNDIQIELNFTKSHKYFTFDVVRGIKRLHFPASHSSNFQLSKLFI